MPRSAVRPVTTTRAPSAAMCFAVAAPMPLVEPVTIAILSGIRTIGPLRDDRDVDDGSVGDLAAEDPDGLLRVVEADGVRVQLVERVAATGDDAHRVAGRPRSRPQRAVDAQALEEDAVGYEPLDRLVLDA